MRRPIQIRFVEIRRRILVVVAVDDGAVGDFVAIRGVEPQFVFLEWATEEEEESKGGKRKTSKQKKADFEKELKAKGLDMEKLKAASTTPEAIKALQAKAEEMEQNANREKLNEKSEEFKALLEDSMKADGEVCGGSPW